MALTLKITSYQSQVLGSDGLRGFDKSGGSIGRAQGNDWVLPDPERYISGRHLTVTYRNNTYYLTDTSTNGVFINQSTSPVGKGNSVALNDGDRLKFGDYEIAVSVDAEAGDADPFGDWQAPVSGGAGEPAAGAAASGFIPDAFDPLEPESPTDSGFNLFPDEPQAAAPAFGDLGAEPDHVSSFEQSFQPPAAQVEQLPDDWDLTDYSQQSASAQVRPPASAPPPDRPQPARASAFPEQGSAGWPPAPQVPPPPAPQAPPPPAAPAPPVQQPAAAPAAASGGAMELYAAFLEGAGLDPQHVQQVDIEQAMRDYGMLFRTVVQGMMEVLMARATLKSEFRLPLTTIRPVENNPLKFSPTVDDALHNLFVAQGRGYLRPVDAIQEGFTDIKHHQMAMMAGMQAAFRELMEIFHPDKFDKEAKAGIRVNLTINRKSRAWDAFCEFYERTVRDADGSFQNLFGENFALAYEEQIRRLSLLK